MVEVINDQLFFPILNAILYSIVFIGYVYLKRKIDLGFIILLIYGLSSIGSALYYSIDYVKPNYTNITITPYLYLFALIVISSFFLLKFDYSQIKHISAPFSNTLLVWISFLFSLMAIDTFIEHIFEFLKFSSSSYASLGSMYSGVEGEGGSGHLYLSWIGRKFNIILVVFKIVIVNLFFYNLAYTKNKFLMYGLLLAVLSNILAAFNSASRGGIIENIMIFLTTYLLFYHTLTKKFLFWFRNILLASSTLIVFFVYTISVARYNDNSDSAYRNSMWEWVGLYVGESFLRFNNDLWQNEEFLDGRNTFGFFLSDSRLQLNEEFESKGNMLLEVFYTYVGDLYIDFGPVGAIISCILISIILFALTRKRLSYPLEIILLMNLFAQVFLIGFTALIYRGDGFGLTAIGALLFCIVLYVKREFKF